MTATGALPIEDYAVLTDGRTSTLIGRDGTVAWLPLPTLDSPPVFAYLIDPERGGWFRLSVDRAREVTRRYLPDTNVIETTITTADEAKVVLTESLNVGVAGRLPWTELARRVDGVEGEARVRWKLVPGDRFGRAQPQISRRSGAPVMRVEDQQLAVVSSWSSEVEDTAVTGSAVISAGQRGLVALIGTDAEPVPLPAADDVSGRIDRSVEHWRRWSSQIDYDGPWAETVRRSALALKTLVYEPAGAIAAAVTTSLPERVGGPKNYDYRYGWVRDSSFALDSIIALGLHEEVHRAVSWLLGALRRSRPELHVFYTLGGNVPGSEDLLEVSGYRQSRPVRSGNGASTQLQLGCYGDLFDTVGRYVERGHVLDSGTGELLAGYADRCTEQWQLPDSGIWELGDAAHYTISKIGCWVALDRATRLADAGQLPDGHVEQWQREREAIHQWVQQRCWSEAKQSYTMAAGTEGLDAAVLLAGRTGFDAGPRLAATCDAVRYELGLRDSPLVYRYSGAGDEEGAFVACTFWLVEALTIAGEADRARTLMEQAVQLVNDVGLLSEEIDPLTGAFLGNLPQGLSHLALINAACILRRNGEGTT